MRFLFFHDFILIVAIRYDPFVRQHVLFNEQKIKS